MFVGDLLFIIGVLVELVGGLGRCKWFKSTYLIKFLSLEVVVIWPLVVL